jgi:hypothetical protein
LRFLSLVAPLLLVACASVYPPPVRDPVNTARSARRIVEPFVKDACRHYARGVKDRATMLACGKWMFFYESFGTYGVPASLPKLLVTTFRDELGDGFERLGLIADPASADHLPFGMAPGRTIGLAQSIAFTCASCHLARLPDGRLAVGAPNHRYAYGHHILALTVFPSMAIGKVKDHDESAVALLQPLLDHLKRKPQIWAKLGGALMEAMGSFKIPVLSPAVERMYASWPPGTQDFVITPLAADDRVEIVGKIPSLFELPRDAEIQSSQMVHGMYGWTGNAQSLVSFMRGFISLGGGDPDKWPEEKLHPLIEYLYSLEAPKNPNPPPARLVAQGKAAFRDKGCLACHGGPRHSGKRVYTVQETGTDGALRHWLDPEGKGGPCCDAKIADPLTRGIKSPRLNALWLQRRFLHNGALSSLEQLFCLEPRPKRETPLGGEGHRETCDGLTVDDKQALIAYLRSL